MTRPAQAAVDRPTGRLTLARPATAVALAVLIVVLLAASGWLGSQIGKVSAANTITGLALVIPFAAIGLVVARRQPRNALGWIFLGVGVFFPLNNVASAYCVLDYRIHHGDLPLGPVAVLLQPSWAPAIVLSGLTLLLFPDARLPLGRWRWLMWAFLGIAALWMLGAFTIAINAIATGNIHVTPAGDLTLINHPTGGWAWWGVAQNVFFPVLAVSMVSSMARQVLSYRGATGERRLQLKWLLSGTAIFTVSAFPVFAWSADAPAALRILSDVGTAGLAALPVSMGIAILKYRLFEIDRLISRTLSYALVTGLLVGIYVGLVTLATRALPFSSPIGVAAATLAAAALFSPLRRRIQHLVDRRFNRAHYNAEATVAEFSAGLRDAVDLDKVQHQLLDVVQRCVQPTHVSVWISGRSPA